MKIAYLVNTYPRASHTFIRREIQALERLGWQVHRFALRSARETLVDPADISEDSRTEHILAQGLRPLIVSALGWMVKRPMDSFRALSLALACGARGAGGVPGTGGRLRHMVYLIEAAHLARRCQDLRLTHVHAHFGTNSATVAMLAAEMGGAGYSVTVHGPEEFDAPMALSLGEKGDRARFILGISSFGRGQLMRWTEPETWRRIHVVHCGIEPWRYTDPSDMPAGGPHLVAVGRLSEQKGFGLLMEAMTHLEGELPGLTLTLVGDGELRPQIEQMIETHGLQGRVRLTGWLDGDRVQEALSDAQALILPSVAEGLPMVIMEAMACGRPVIATAIAGIPELVHRDVGWLVPSGDPQALAQAIRDMANEPPERLMEMGRAARQRVLKRHDINALAERLTELFASRGQS